MVSVCVCWTPPPPTRSSSHGYMGLTTPHCNALVVQGKEDYCVLYMCSLYLSISICSVCSLYISISICVLLGVYSCGKLLPIMY